MVATATWTARPWHSVAEIDERIARVFSANEFGADLTGAYKSERMPSGNFAIRNVDVFRAVKRENPHTRAVDNFDGEWLGHCVAKFQERKAEGYLPPVAAGAHNSNKPGGTKPQFGGHLDNLRVDSGPKGVPTLYADIVEIPPTVFRDIAQRRLPYRSVEINDPKTPEISALALLDTTVPFHKFQLLRVDVPEGVEFSQGGEPVCFAATTRTLDVVQRFDRGVANMAEPTRFAQRFGCGSQKYADEGDGEDMPPMGGDEMDDDPLAGLSDEDLEALLAEEEAAMGGLDDGGDMPLDEAEAAELQQEGMDMGALGEALQGIRQEIGEMKTMMAAQTATGAPAQATPSPYSESTSAKVDFSESKTTTETNTSSAGNGSVTISRAEWEGLLSRVERQDETINKMVAFQEQQQAEEDMEAFAQFVGQHFGEVVSKIEDTYGCQLDDEQRRSAWKLAAGEAEKLYRESDIQDPQKFAEVVREAVDGEVAGYARGALGTPRKSGEPAPASKGAPAPRNASLTADMQTFAEAVPEAAQILEDAHGRIAFGEAAKEWDAFDPQFREAFNNDRIRFIRTKLATARAGSNGSR